jgi:O-antigen/teichoic acid export membrane protein
LAGKGFAALLSIVYLAAAARGLGPARFGQFVLMLGLGQAISSIVSFQTWRIVVRFGAIHRARGDEQAFARVALFCIALDILSAITGCVIAWVGVGLIGPLLGWTTALAQDALLYTFVVLLAIRSAAIGLLRVTDRFRDSAAADSVMAVTRLAGALLILAIGPTPARFLIAWGASEVTTALAYWLLVRRHVPIRIDRAVIAGMGAIGEENPGLWRFAGLTNLGATMTAAQQQLPLLLVGIAAGPVAAGLFRFAYQLGQALQRLADMLSRALFAELADVHAREGAVAMHALFLRTNRVTYIGSAVVMAAIILLGYPALYLIGGDAYLPAYIPLLLLGGAAAIELAGASFEPALLSAGKSGTALAIRALAVLLLCILLWLLLPRFAETGAGAAMLLSTMFAILLFRMVGNRLILQQST